MFTSMIWNLVSFVKIVIGCAPTGRFIILFHAVTDIPPRWGFPFPGLAKVGENFGNLGTSPFGPPNPQEQKLYPTQEKHNDTTNHVIPHADAESPTQLGKT